MTHSASFYAISQLMSKVQGPYFLPAIVMFTATVACFAIQATAPVPDVNAAVEPMINVSVMPVQAEPFVPSFHAYGTVIAKNSFTLTAQVDGAVTFLADNAIEGGILEAGELVFTQDSADLTALAAQRKAQMAIAKARLELESGQQRIAEKDYQMMKQDFDEKDWQIDHALLLRQPQLAQAHAEFSIAKNELNIANNNLNRSQWRSDKRYLVVSKQVSKGDYLQKGAAIAKLVELSAFRVPLYLPRDIAAKVQLGQTVLLHQPDTKFELTAKITHVLPALESSIHLQKVFAEYQVSPQPREAGKGRNNSVQPKLILGDFVEARFQFEAVEDTLTVPLSAIDGRQIWLVNADNKLQSRTVTVFHQDESIAVINNVIAATEQLVVNKMHSPQAELSVNIVERF